MRVFILAFLLFAASLAAQTMPPTDPTAVTIDSQASVTQSVSVCQNIAAVTDLWSLAPASINTASALWLVRYVTIQNVELSAAPFATEYFAVKVGGAAPTALTDGLRLFSGASIQINTRRPTTKSVYGGAFPNGPIPIWLRPSDATVSTCITWWL